VESYDLLKQTWPAERVIVFLRNKRWEAESLGLLPDSLGAGHDLYPVVCEEGVFRDVGGQTGLPVGGEAEWLADAEQLPFDDLTRQVPDVAAR